MFAYKVFYFGLNFWSGGEDISYIMIGITLLVDSILGLMLYRYSFFKSLLIRIGDNG